MPKLIILFFIRLSQPCFNKIVHPQNKTRKNDCKSARQRQERTLLILVYSRVNEGKTETDKDRKRNDREIRREDRLVRREEKKRGLAGERYF